MIGLDADLRAEVAGLHMRIDGTGNVLTCRLDDNAAELFMLLVRSGPLLATLRAIVPVLTRTGIRLDVVVGTQRVGRAGSGVTQNALARILHLPSVHVGA